MKKKDYLSWFLGLLILAIAAGAIGYSAWSLARDSRASNSFLPLLTLPKNLLTVEERDSSLATLKTLTQAGEWPVSSAALSEGRGNPFAAAVKQ